MSRHKPIAIVGAAEADLGQVAPDMTAMDLMAQATVRALDDAGLRLHDIDGVFALATQTRMSTMGLCEYLQIQPRYHDVTYMGGSATMTLLAHAQAAIGAGLCNVALITYASTQRSGGRNNVSPREYNAYETPFNPKLPATAYALAASRHMHRYGTTREQMAQVAVAAREWALLNPAAWETEPLTVDQVLGARVVSYPLTVRDCCLVTDGGGAIIVCSAERAKHLRKSPVYVLGTGEHLSHLSISSMPDLCTTGAVHSSGAAYQMAGLKPKDMDLAMVYDAFTINTIVFMEDLGFCPKGDGGAFVENGAIAPNGKFPVNTNGGGLSFTHPGQYGIHLLVEATRQLRGEAGDRQVHCDTAIAHGNGAVLSSQSTVILGNELTV